MTINLPEIGMLPNSGVKIDNKVVLEPQVSPENASKYVDTVTVFAKT